MTRKPEEVASSNRHYAENLKKLGDAAQICDWGSAGSQRARFDALMTVGDLRGRSILDLGCGLGGFYDHLRAHGVRTSYTGYDISPEMVEAARVRNPEARFEVVNITEPSASRETFDVVVASGIFNRRISDNEGYIEATLAAMWERCRWAMAANFITTWADPQAIGPETWQTDPAALLAAGRKLSRRLVFRHDYLPHDGTLILYRHGQV